MTNFARRLGAYAACSLACVTLAIACSKSSKKSAYEGGGEAGEAGLGGAGASTGGSGSLGGAPGAVGGAGEGGESAGSSSGGAPGAAGAGAGAESGGAGAENGGGETGAGGDGSVQVSEELDPADADTTVGIGITNPYAGGPMLQYFGWEQPSAGGIYEWDFHFGKYAVNLAVGQCGVFDNVTDMGDSVDYVSFGQFLVKDGSQTIATINPVPGFFSYSGQLPGATPGLYDLEMSGSAAFPATTVGLDVLAAPAYTVVEPNPEVPAGGNLQLQVAGTSVGFTRAAVVIQGPTKHVLCYADPEWETMAVSWNLINQVLVGAGQRYAIAYMWWVKYRSMYYPLLDKRIVMAFEANAQQAFSILPAN